MPLTSESRLLLRLFRSVLAEISGLLVSSASSQGYKRQKENPGTHYYVVPLIQRSLACLFLSTLQSFMFVLFIILSSIALNGKNR